MDLRQLNALVAVADHGTFSAAAKALHTVQSNVSTHVARLEAELGARLIDRASGSPTEEGGAIVARARRIAAELEAMRTDIAAIQEEVRGTERLGVIGTTARWLVPSVLRALGDAHPAVRLLVLEGNTTTLLPLLDAGRLDDALVTLPVDRSDLVVERLFDEDLVLVAPATHPMALTDALDLAELGGTPLLLPAPGTALRAELDAAAATAGVELVPQAEMDGVRLIASLAFAGFGPAILPATAVPGWLREGQWRRVELIGTPRRQVGLARLGRALPSAPSRAVREILLAVVAEQLHRQPGIHVPTG